MAEDVETTDKKRTRDPELAAMSRITNQLAELDPKARKRVAAYLLDRLGESGDLPPATS